MSKIDPLTDFLHGFDYIEQEIIRLRTIEETATEYFGMIEITPMMITDDTYNFLIDKQRELKDLLGV